MEAGRRGETSVLFLRSPHPDHFAGDVDYPYRPDNDLYYLTGIADDGCALLLSAAGVVEHGREVLFVTRSDPADRLWTGGRLSPKEAAVLAGLAESAVLPIDEVPKSLARAIGAESGPRRAGREPPMLYFDTGAGFRPGRAVTEPYGFLLDALGSRAFALDLRSPAELIHPLRQRKSPAEVALLRKAIDATSKALVAAMRRSLPGMHEFEIQAEIEAVFLREGCAGWGFPSIVATGPNTCVLHYGRYDRQSRDGDLVLLDIGAQYAFYSADVTRTFPVSGRFTPRQRQLYEVVLDAQKAGIAAVRPGATLGEVDRAARGRIAAGLRRLGAITRDHEARRYFPHGTSHGLGLAVHDPMPEDVLAPGMVVTVEPGLYLPEEAIGIRIEDDVLVTDEGREVLSSAAPKEVDELERVLAGRGF
jgi:Xaa-Pro aminopeptidase